MDKIFAGASHISKQDFNAVVEENTDFVMAIVKKFVKNPETAKDLAQEIFLRAYLSYERYVEDGKIRAWLSVIANNMLKNHYKTEEYQNSFVCLSPIEYISDELLPSQSLPEDIIIQQDLLGKIMKTINCLPEKQRDAIIYSYLYGYSDKEISAIQDMTLSAVKSAKHFGLQKVKKLMAADYTAGIPSTKKHKLNNKFGRYKVIKSYTYDNENGKFTEHTKLQKESVIELVSPSQKEIEEVAEFLKNNGGDENAKLGEKSVKALISGDFDKIDVHAAAARVNGALNVMILAEYIIISHDGKNGEYRETVQDLCSIWALTAVSGYINLDYMDLCHIMRGAKTAVIASGRGKGENKSDAGTNALASPFLSNINNAKGLIISMVAAPGTGQNDIDNILNKIKSSVSRDADIIFGVNFARELSDEIIATVMVTNR